MASSWQETIDTIEAMAARGELYAEDLRAGLNALQNALPPVPPVVAEKIADWQFLLDTNVFPSRVTAGTGSLANMLPEVSPMVLVGAGLVLWLLMRRR